MKKSKLYSCLLYDMKEGIMKMYPCYLLEIVLVALFSYMACFIVKDTGDVPDIKNITTLIFSGMEEYTYVKGGAPFQIPIEYLALGLLSGIFASYYPRREWNLRGDMYITRYQSKGIWWWSKCIWCMMQMMCYYVIIFLTIWIVTGKNGNWEIPQDFKNIFVYVFLLGFFTSVVLNQMLITFQMFWSPAIGYVFLLVELAMSAFRFHPYLIGNNYMLVRTILFRKDGITLQGAILRLIVLWLVFVI